MCWPANHRPCQFAFPTDRVVAVADQRNAWRRLSIWSRAQLDKQHAILMWIGIADRVTSVSKTRPACVRIPAFHVRILDATKSTSDCSSARFKRLSDSGTPRYLHGNGATTHGKACWTAAITSSEHLIGVATHLLTLVTRPDAPAKSWRIWITHCRSFAFGATNSTRSSAYRDAR